ncbi:hypothetical protein DYQ86_03415 [Acidobacteria bacterium AB60]|nr:hypothetical protein DYQ86_03415 [Acidobacteria bacterium AB60]
MWGLLTLIANLFSGYRAYREDRRAGRWSTSRFLVVIAFAGLEVGLVLAPLALPMASKLFSPVLLAGWFLALVNFAWFVPLMRKWRTVRNERR